MTNTPTAPQGASPTAPNGKRPTGTSPRKRKLRPQAAAQPREKKDFLTVGELRLAVDSWLLDGDARLSPKTVGDRRNLTNKLLWFLRTFGPDGTGSVGARCDRATMTAFFVYMRTAHERPEGRWGAPGGDGSELTPSEQNRSKRPMRPRSAANYYRWLRTLFLFLVDDGTLEESPLKHIKPPAHRDDQPEPFTGDQVDSLLKAARNGPQPRRDEAILLLFLDTGARSSEVCGLSVGDFSSQQRTVRVHGKGDFYRVLPLTARTCRAVMAYLRERTPQPEEPLFESFKTGDHLTSFGMTRLIQTIGKRAKVEGVRCSPHTLRHTFGHDFIANDGQQMALQRMFGHTSLAMTNRYVNLAQADTVRQHAHASPVANLDKKGKGRR